MTKALTALAVAAIMIAPAAWADSLTLAGTVSVSGNGFGSMSRALSIQSHGSATVESGCIAPSGGGLISGATACAVGDGVVGGNEAPPIGFPKQAAPTLSSLSITNGNQIGIMFDAVQPQGNSGATSLNVTDLTLKLYNQQGQVIYSVSGSWSGLGTNPGNGSSDYLFVLDPAAVAAFNAAMAGNTNDQIALDSTINFDGQVGGPESYTLVNTAPTPEPSSLVLLGTGIFCVGFGMYARRKHPVAGMA